ncbi:cell wall glucanase [Metarhizium album ARSEF 1941]|uniref:Cell wall glucanase n=1 Tax=Metarhizium album (strain ARSEF 1941) TaxID=1081103 RepID=A0A0B2X6P3_METAS|nr:cell wall glucanase [Metarhizium album ARSEF 1941]KHO01140.1 cell wall glucanase [Metarhizium album ARSEF 1941]
MTAYNHSRESHHNTSNFHPKYDSLQFPIVSTAKKLNTTANIARILSYKVDKEGPITSIIGVKSTLDEQHESLSLKLVPLRAVDTTLAIQDDRIAKNGIHIFLDMSNINISFHSVLKGKFSIGEHARFVPLPQLNLQFLTEILVRDRKIMTLNAGCSVLPHCQEPRFVQELRDLGYRVDLRERKRAPECKRGFNEDSKAGEASSSDELVFPRSGGRYVEDLVDETLQTRIAESVMEYFQDQGTLVIATGKHDAYSTASDEGEGDVIVCDPSISSATRGQEVITWMNEEGEALSTVSESVLPLPTAAAPGNMTIGDISTSLPPFSTRTLFVSPSKSPATASHGRRIAAPLDSPATATSRAVSSGTKAVGSIKESGGEYWTRGLFGVSYTPYRSDQNCKSQQDVDNDFQRLAGDYSLVRIYGTDCDQVPMLYSAAKQHGMKLFLGIWNPSAVEDETSKIISGVNGDWDTVHTVSVGNERVNNGETSPQDMIRSMNKARCILRAAGYDGPVVTVDTFTAALAHPELCDESDYCAVNAHAFFDSTIAAPQSGKWLRDTVSRLESTIDANKKVVVAETGWPVQGATNGLAVPGLSNQKAALDSIKNEFADRPGDVILFSAFNDLWKQKNIATFDADQFWGIGGAVSSCDQ